MNTSRRLLAAVAVALSWASPVAATPIVYSPYVIQPAWAVTGSISDQWGYVRTTKDCPVFSDYPSQRVFPAGMVFQMIIYPNGHPASDPSVWAYNANNEYMQGVAPLGVDPHAQGAGFYLPVSCLEGVRRA